MALLLPSIAISYNGKLYVQLPFSMNSPVILALFMISVLYEWLRIVERYTMVCFLLVHFTQVNLLRQPISQEALLWIQLDQPYCDRCPVSVVASADRDCPIRRLVHVARQQYNRHFVQFVSDAL